MTCLICAVIYIYIDDIVHYVMLLNTKMKVVEDTFKISDICLEVSLSSTSTFLSAYFAEVLRGIISKYKIRISI